MACEAVQDLSRLMTSMTTTRKAEEGCRRSRLPKSSCRTAEETVLGQGPCRSRIERHRHLGSLSNKTDQCERSTHRSLGYLRLPLYEESERLCTTPALFVQTQPECDIEPPRILTNDGRKLLSRPKDKFKIAIFRESFLVIAEGILGSLESL